MSVEIGLVSLAVLLLLLVIRVPIAIALISVSLGGLSLLLGWETTISLLASKPYEFVSKWTLSAVPLFLLMGFVCYHSGLTAGLFNAAKFAFKWLPGGIAISSILASAGFAAVSGSSVACSAAMGRISIPEMVKGGYRPSFACGTIAAGGTIGALIPPSILLIIYGVFVQESITRLFVGGISVGLMTTFSYCAVILLMALFKPEICPRVAKGTEEIVPREAFLDIWPVIVLVLLVFGGLFGGFFTATEAGAFGAVGSITLALVLGRVGFRGISEAFFDTLSTTAMLLIIGIGASMFTLLLGLSGLAGYITSSVSGLKLTYLELMCIVVVIYLILGLFMEPFGAMLVTLPVMTPVLESYGLSLVWFGVLLVKLLEIGMITPPVGMNIFVIKAVAGEYASLVDIFRGVSFYLIADLAVVALIIFFPALIL